MKRLLKITLTFWMQSLGFMLPYLILGILVDRRIYFVWGLIYPLQFIGAIAYQYAEGIASLSVIRSDGEHNSKEAGVARNTGFIFLIGYGIIFFILSQLFMADYLEYFGGWADFVKPCILAGSSYTIYCLFWYKAYIEDVQGNHVVRYGVTFLVSSMVGVIASIIFDIKDTYTIVLLLFIPNLISILATLVVHYRKVKYRHGFDMRMLKNGISAMPRILGSLMISGVYILGYRRTGLSGESTLLTLSSIGICFDSAWDAGSSICQHYEALADKGNKDLVYNILGRAVVLGLLLPIIPLAIIFLSNSVYDVMLLAAESIALVIYPVYSVFKCYFQLNTALVVGTAVTLSIEALRLMFTWLIPSPYSSEYSLLVAYIVTIAILIIAHSIHRRKNRVYPTFEEVIKDEK